MIKLDNVVEMVMEFWCKDFFDFFYCIGVVILVDKINGFVFSFLYFGVGGYY